MSETNVLQATFTGAVLKMLQFFHDKWDKEHSLQYTLEDCLVAGINAKQRSKEYSVATENRKRFEREIASDPSVILDPVRMLRLCKKYGIGSANQQFENQVLEAATKPAAQPTTETTPPTESAKAA